MIIRSPTANWTQIENWRIRKLLPARWIYNFQITEGWSHLWQSHPWFITHRDHATWFVSEKLLIVWWTICEIQAFCRVESTVTQATAMMHEIANAHRWFLKRCFPSFDQHSELISSRSPLSWNQITPLPLSLSVKSAQRNGRKTGNQPFLWQMPRYIREKSTSRVRGPWILAKILMSHCHR
jgi:hypothetical protein